MIILIKRFLPHLLFILTSALLALPVQASPTSDGYTLKIGRITSNPRKDLDKYKVLADYLATRLKNAGIKGGKVVFARNINEMAELIKNGQVDVISDSLYPQLKLGALAGLEFIAAEHRDDTASYHSILITRKDSGLNQLSDLKGKVVAFEDETSTPSYFVPLVTFTQSGITLVHGTPSAEQVGYTFAREEINISKWVHAGKVAVGALSSKDWMNPKRMPPYLKKDLQIIYRSANFPRAVLGVRADLDPQIKSALRELLLEKKMSASDQAEIVRYRGVTGYSSIESDEFGWFERHLGIAEQYMR